MSVITSAVKQLAINTIQNKSFCLNKYECVVCTLYIYSVYIN